MAKPKRKAPKSKPVIRHQLFPAVVALWFGALFGLGSLAVRPSLLEDLVIRSRIDLLIPAAAPPLGMTARMALALAMAALGAMLGAAIARRIARPKQEVRERKRTNLSTRDEGAGNASFNTYADASTRIPGPAGSELPGAAVATPGVLAGRRRSLAIEHEQDDFVPHDMAPLPGGAPQIFDIAASGLNDARPLPTAAFEPGIASELTPAAPPTAVALDWGHAAPVFAAAGGMPAAVLPQVFAPAEPVAQIAPIPAPEPAFPALQTAPQDDRQVFGMAQPATPPADVPRQIFGAPVTDDHVSKDFVESQGFSTSVFVTPEPSSLFPARVGSPQFSPIPEAFAPPVEVAAFVQAEEPGPAPPAIQAEPEPALPSPASLGIEDLSARLAESMRRRRAGRAEPAAVADPAPVTTAEAVPVGMRPLDLTGFEEDDHTANESLLPPRRIAFPAEAAPIAAFVQIIVAPAEGEPEVAEDVAVAEENYASLLDVTPSPASLRNPFVRVEEPATKIDPDTIEPVVIFPGQAVPPPLPFATAANIGVEEAVPFRRFDSPSNAGQGQPSAANEAASAMPSEEAERALRSALANLQRMSGAA